MKITEEEMHNGTHNVYHAAAKASSIGKKSVLQDLVPPSTKCYTSYSVLYLKIEA